MSRLVTKPTMWLCAQQRLRSALASAQSDQSLLWAQWVAKGPSFFHADSEDSDQTGHTLTLLVLSRGGSYHLVYSSCYLMRLYYEHTCTYACMLFCCCLPLNCMTFLHIRFVSAFMTIIIE